MAALKEAESNLAKGEIFYNVQDITTTAGGGVTDIGRQRSAGAYNKNKDKGNYKTNVDTRMWLLKFTQAGKGAVGMINWYAIHPTSLVRSGWCLASTFGCGEYVS